MHAVLLTLQLPEEASEAEDALREHGMKLHDWPGVVAVTALRDGIHCGFFLLFHDSQEADRYLQSREVQRLPNMPGCTDVYIHRFNTIEVAEPAHELESSELSYVS
ncbi:MAG: hypothetical protein ACOC9Y_09825 [Chloroflexota bacterium]